MLGYPKNLTSIHFFVFYSVKFTMDNQQETYIQLKILSLLILLVVLALILVLILALL